MTPPQHQNPWGSHPTAPVSPPRIHPGRWLCPSQPAPAAPAAAPWPCLCRVVSHCRGAEQPRVPPLSPALPAPHSCDGSTSTARPRGAEEDRAPPGSPRVQKTAGSHQTPDTRHRGCGHQPGLGEGKLRHRGVTGRLWWSCPPPPPAVPGPHGCPVPTSAPRATRVWHGAGLAPWVGKQLELSHPKLTQNPKPRAFCLPRAVAAFPARERISPSLPKGLWLLLQIKWKWGSRGLEGGGNPAQLWAPSWLHPEHLWLGKLRHSKGKSPLPRVKPQPQPLGVMPSSLSTHLGDVARGH